MNPDGALPNLARRTRECLSSLPDAAPFLAAWPDGADRRTVPDSAPAAANPGQPLPVLECMTEIARDVGGFAGALVADLCRDAYCLEWRQSYTAAEVGAEFLRNYGWTSVVGPHAPMFAAHVACGFLLLGPHTSYPSHRHEAEEIYVPLSGTACWQQGDAAWRERPPGSVIHHASEEPHAMHTGARPLLALYVWRSRDLTQTARLA